MSNSTRPESGFSLELVAMVAVIAISSWHVGSYMNTFDGWVMAAIMGATLGFCNFLMAHNIFKPHSTSRFPSFCGLIFFACTSTYMQYIYFNATPEIGTTLFMGINLDAMALGVWAPAAEILLGWVYAAGLRQPVTTERSPKRRASKFERLADAVTTKVEQQLNAGTERGSRSSEQQPSVHTNRHASSMDVQFHGNGTSSAPNLNVNPSAGNDNTNSSIEHQKLSKAEALERMQEIYHSNPEASYEEIGRAIGRSKGTVANYMKELKSTDEHGV